MLVLPIKKEYFDMILSGDKKEEYKEIKSYYNQRLEKYLGRNDNKNEYALPVFQIILRNGYSHKDPSIKCECVLHRGPGREELGAKLGKMYYVISILRILEVKNIK